MPSQKISKKGVRIIICFFVFALLLSSSFDLWGSRFLPSADKEVKTTFSEKLRNKRIDAIKPHINQKNNSLYTDEDIESAVNVIKDNFKERDVYVSLFAISFDESENRLYSRGVKDNNTIVFLCDYFVLKDFAAYSKGIFNGYKMILKRENENAPWIIFDQGHL